MLQLIKGVLNAEKLREVLEILAQAEFVDGRQTAGGQARAVKDNIQVSADSKAGQAAAALVLAALRDDNRFILATRPHTVQNPLFSRYVEGMAYGDHLDNPIMLVGGQKRRTDISVTVFLNNPGDYDSGALVINTDYGQQAFKGDAGDALVYPSTLIHHVAPVTRGMRQVAVTWVQSAVRDPAQRKILYDLAMAAAQLSEATPPRPEAATVFKCHHNLLRMWADT